MAEPAACKHMAMSTGSLQVLILGLWVLSGPQDVLAICEGSLQVLALIQLVLAGALKASGILRQLKAILCFVIFLDKHTVSVMVPCCCDCQACMNGHNYAKATDIPSSTPSVLLPCCV